MTIHETATRLVADAPFPRAAEILTPEALDFVEELHRRFADRRDELLGARARRREHVHAGGTLGFLPETRAVRDADWRVAPAPAALRDRRVEITGPATPAKSAINALNSGADVWLADLEDASTPTWHNIVDAVLNLRDAALGALAWTSPEGKEYRLRTDRPRPVVVMRPRGWHLREQHVEIAGERAIGALVDFGLHFFHTARPLLAAGHGPYYYLPKMESHLEARLWNDVFFAAEDYLGIDRGTIRATALVETIPAAFEMDEILYELREHASGLNAGRWDYLFSIVKTFSESGPEYVIPDRTQVTMTAPFMQAYTELLVRTCHRRGAFAMGGMAAAVPSRKDPEAAARALAAVRADKDREAHDGFDGSWVAHPDLVATCRAAFDAVLGDKPNQLDRVDPSSGSPSGSPSGAVSEAAGGGASGGVQDEQALAARLLDIAVAGGTRTEQGVRDNLSVAVAYVGAWLSGSGAVAIRGLMEDAATAEISRCQVWQQRALGIALDDTGERVSAELVDRLLAEEVDRLRSDLGPAFDDHYEQAAILVGDLVRADDLAEFLTVPAYELLGGHRA